MLRKNSRWTAFVLCLTVALLLMTACDRKAVYSHYEPTPLEGWESNDTLDFFVGVVEHAGYYKESVGLRTTDDYPFTGLTLIVEQRVFPVYRERTDTLNATLVDPEGVIMGTGVGIFQYVFPLRRLYLNKGDSLYVTIRHYMKREILPGIHDVGFTLERE